jgi:glutamyl-tRNA reductase
MQRLLLLGLNHTTAPLDVREKVAFSPEQARRALEAMRSKFSDAEIVLLSTCNRIELYVSREVHGHPRADEMAEFLAEFHAIELSHLKPHLYEKDGRAAIEHLFNVASSLDSMVLGETQILGQVRSAYELAAESKTAGTLLHPLFQRAIAVGKQVMHETSLGDGRLSVASIAVDYAKRIFDRFDDKTILCVGAGKMTQLVLRHFAELSPRRQLICNRDPAKSEKLAAEFKGDAVPFEFLIDHVAAADIVITSTGATRPILTREQFNGILKARRFRPIFIIDIAVPRDVEASVGELDAVYLYNLDDLQKVVTGTQSQRSGAIDSAQTIVAQHVDEFLLWNRSRQMGPIIDQLFKRYHAMAQEEVARTLNKMPNLSDADREQLDELVRRVVNKLLHDPISTLKQSDNSHTPAGPYLHALTKLFQLPDPPEEL